jgi:outer membrane receptor protein involved in Fe transport
MTAAGVLAGAAPAGAQTTSQAESQDASQKNASQASPTQVVVNGRRAEAGDRVDRRVYDIGDDPQARTGTVADILARLPSVQVTPAGKLTLRGDPGVTVLVDGKQPAAGNAVIQTLPAADIDRVEVMTNPSAQYGPDGAAGIVNIITKKRHPLGVSGSLNSRISEIGEWVNAGTLIFTSGPWSVDSRLRYVHSPYHGTRLYTQALPEAETEYGGWRGAADNLLGNVNIAYKLGGRSTFTLEGQDYHARAKTASFARHVSAARTYDGLDVATNDMGQRDIEGVYDFNDDKTGSHLTLDADHTDYDAPAHQTETDTYGAGTALYGEHRNVWGPEDNLKGDYERDFTSGRELTAGVELDQRVTHIARTVFDKGSVAGPEPDGFTHTFLGRRKLYSAYAAYQFPLGPWTVLPGLRVEAQRQSVAAGGLTARDDRVQLYPSLHFSRALSPTTKLKLSYARRVTRPDISDYDPGVISATPFARQTGNPDLKPSDTDSFEAAYNYAEKKTTRDVTLFYRVTHDLQSQAHFADANGVVVARPANGGEVRYGGTELTLKAPLWTHWKYTLNATLQVAEVPQLTGRERHVFGYSGNGVLQCDMAHGGQWQLTAGVTGRRYTIDGYTGATSHVDVAWQHPLTPKVSLVVSASDLFRGDRTLTVVDTPLVRSRQYMQPFDQVLRVALAWKFGAKAHG